MNTEVRLGKMIVLLVAFSGIAVVAYFIGLKGDERMIVNTPTSPTVNQTLVQKTNETLYVNKDLGFQITFPGTWNQYKVEEGQGTITFLLPTSDKAWQTSNKDFPGYGAIFGLNIWTTDEFDKACKASMVACSEAYLIGETGTHMVTFFAPQDTPSDFAQYTVGGSEYLRQNFQALETK